MAAIALASHLANRASMFENQSDITAQRGIDPEEKS
jgi:hypothetical protein